MESSSSQFFDTSEEDNDGKVIETHKHVKLKVNMEYLNSGKIDTLSKYTCQAYAYPDLVENLEDSKIRIKIEMSQMNDSYEEFADLKSCCRTSRFSFWISLVYLRRHQSLGIQRQWRHLSFHMNQIVGSEILPDV